MTHEQVQDLLGAYALDAVDPEEAALVADHLETCPRCRSDISDLRETAARIAQAGPAPPERVWEQIAAALDEPTGSPPPLRLDPSPRAARRARAWRAAGIAVAAVAAAALLVLGVEVHSLSGRVHDLRAASGRSPVATLDGAALDAITTPGARLARMTGPAGDQAVAVVTPGGQGFVLAGTLTDVSPKLYELWGQTSNGAIVALGTMRTPGTYAFAADPSTAAIMMTVEDHPVAAPSTIPVLVGTLA